MPPGKKLMEIMNFWKSQLPIMDWELPLKNKDTFLRSFFVARTLRRYLRMVSDSDCLSCVRLRARMEVRHILNLPDEIKGQDFISPYRRINNLILNMMNKKKILLIEDDEMILKPLELALRAEGFAVEVAKDGEKGIALFYDTPPDLVLLDLILPKVSGFDVLEKIRIDAVSRKIPIIILSNLAR